MPVRPTTDQAKEAIFNIIQNNFYIEEINVLDLFAGTGSISYEFCSRGAKHVIAVEMEHKCVEFIKRTSEALHFENLKVVRSNVFKFLRYAQGSYDIIFADPPYDMDKISELPELIFKRDLLSKDGWLIIEHPKEIDFSGFSRFSEQRRYGKVNFSIFLCEQGYKKPFNVFAGQGSRIPDNISGSVDKNKQRITFYFIILNQIVIISIM